MKKLKLNLFMVAAVAIAAVTMSFKMASTASTFHYTDIANPGVFSDPANWQPGNSPITCGDGTAKPCQITAEDPADLEAKLDGLDNASVMAIVSSKRK